MVYICLAEKAGEINVVKVSALPFFNDSAPSCIQICYYHCCLPYSRRAVVACTSLFNCCWLLLIVVVEIKENDYSISGFYPVFQVFTPCFRFLPCLFQVFTTSISGSIFVSCDIFLTYKTYRKMSQNVFTRGGSR